MPSFGIAATARLATAKSRGVRFSLVMEFHILDPLEDLRWNDFVVAHPHASVFHQVGWIQALTKTYGYRPFVVTSAPPGEPLADGIVFCDVNSWLTGRRLVSLPFSDHLQPLVRTGDMTAPFVTWAAARISPRRLKYVELRPAAWNSIESSFAEGEAFWFHDLDISGSLQSIYNRMHKDCFQRRIRRAEREGLNYETGLSARHIEVFYGLMARTRKRHHLFPQPLAWFRNVAAAQDPKPLIHIASKGETPVAAMLTLFHGQTLVYKYGCSDERFHYLGGMPFLFWKVIEKGKAIGALQLDLGRTDHDHASLKEFKERLGASCSRITYQLFGASDKSRSGGKSFRPAAKRIISMMPDWATSRMGTYIYRHLG